MKKDSASSKWFSLAGFAVLIGAVGLVFFTGCSDYPVAPTTDNHQAKMDWLASVTGTPGGAPDGVQLSPGNRVKPQIDVTVSEYILANKGGKIKFKLDKDQFEFKVDKKSLTQDAEITIRAQKWDSPYGPIWTFDCSPEGLVFLDKPLELEVKGLFSKEYSVLWYWNPDTGEWEVQQVLEGKFSHDKREFEIWHFSKYGIS
ncbi:MAG: hypothetical protein ABIE70_10820 [bacterium]